MRYHSSQRRSPRSREPLEAGQLGLYSDAGWRCRVDQAAAVIDNSVCCLLAGARAGHLFSCLRPELCWIRIEPEHDLRLTLIDCGRQPCREAGVQRGLRPRPSVGQLLTAFLSTEPDLNFGDLEALI